MIGNIKEHWREHLVTTFVIIASIAFIVLTVVYIPMIWIWIYCIVCLSLLVGLLNRLGFGCMIIDRCTTLWEKYRG